MPSSFDTVALKVKAEAETLLATEISKAQVPIGTILAIPSTGVPSGYLICDGSQNLSRTTYADLFAVIGTAHGFTSGTTFRIPDYRGRFLRGVDGSAGEDPDKTSRTAMGTGGNTGNLIGSVQGDQFKVHKHRMSPGTADTSANAPGGSRRYPDISNGIQPNWATYTGSPVSNDATNGSNSPDNDGGTESRPKNAYVNFMIRVF